MGAIRKDRFIKALTEGVTGAPIVVTGYNQQISRSAGALARQLWDSNMVPRSALMDTNFNAESAARLYDQLCEYVAMRGYYPGKWLRPWEIDAELYNDLDSAQPWWGFEFETGYQSAETRGEIVREVWEKMDNVCFDSEGEGNYRVEITFAPEERSKYLNGTANAYRFMELLDAKRNTHVAKTDAVMVGCHLNVSVPGLGENNFSAITTIMNNSLSALPIHVPGTKRNLRHEFFGRSRLYGGFYGHNSPIRTNPDGTPVEDSQPKYWLEGKLFRTSYHLDRFKQYLTVCDGLTKCLEFLVTRDPKLLNRVSNRSPLRMIPTGMSADYDEDGMPLGETRPGNVGAYISNLVDVILKGADPQIANWDESEELEDNGLNCLVSAFPVSPAVCEAAVTAAPAVAEQQAA